MKKPDSVVVIPGSLDTFFRNWLVFLRPFHQLTDREMDIATAFLKQRQELSSVISDPDILDRELMSDYSKKKIMEECNIALPHFQVILGKLRKGKFLVNNRINPRFIPVIDKDSDSFKLLLYFKLK